jgi:hypothetical protein
MTARNAARVSAGAPSAQAASENCSARAAATKYFQIFMLAPQLRHRFEK